LAVSLPIQEFLKKAQALSVIDVRSEGEFEHGHIPGAINIPIFNNEERARVGTLYKQEGQEQAIELGLEIVGPKLVNFVREVKSRVHEKEVLVHCWRGGMRSGSFAWLMETSGLKAYTLTKGYKAYRNHLHNSFAYPYKFILLGGKTGSGKTRILQKLKERNEQVIDLEWLCNHKGSSFGALGQARQPSTEQFENNLYEVFLKLNPEKRIWLEDESKNLGNIFLPDPIWERMKDSPLLFVEIDKKSRIENLVNEYSLFPENSLADAITRIRKKLGGLNYKLAMEALQNKDFSKVADLTLLYYDRAYISGLEERNKDKLVKFENINADETKIAEMLISEADKIYN
jgi:tRNA 2-selenouridine synthase